MPPRVAGPPPKDGRPAGRGADPGERVEPPSDTCIFLDRYQRTMIRAVSDRILGVVMPSDVMRKDTKGPALTGGESHL